MTEIKGLLRQKVEQNSRTLHLSRFVANALQ